MKMLFVPFFLVVVMTAVIAVVSRPPNSVLEKVFKSVKFSVNNVESFPVFPTYGIFAEYEDANCSVPTISHSFLLDTCLVGYSSSAIYTCSDGVLTETYYYDTACTKQSSPSTLATTTCSSNKMIVSCGGSDGTAFPGNPVSFSNFELSTCQNLISASSFQRDLCMDGLKLIWPNWKIYGSPDCSDNPLYTIPISTQCSGPSDDPDAFDYGTYSLITTGSGDFPKLTIRLAILLLAMVVGFHLIQN